MEEYLARPAIEAAVQYIRQRLASNPRIGLVLGSGLGPLADELADAQRIPYTDIPHWPTPTVRGHAGELVAGRLAHHEILVMRGRIHFYEGYSMAQVTLPMRVMQLLGIEIVILTNAAGGLSEEMKPGDLMLINDHLNMLGMAGFNPLRGPNDSSLGLRFPDMGMVYDPALRATAKQVAAREGIPLFEGVYVSLAGPSFETPAELRYLKMIGADAVGMSTAPEAVVARHGGMRVLGISGISNIAQLTPVQQSITPHEEVLETGRIIAPRLIALLKGVLAALPSPAQ